MTYYDPALKDARLAILKNHDRFEFEKVDLADREPLFALFKRHRFAHVVHLAAQAGVRYSIDHPHAYASSNLDGFLNMLEACRHNGCEHLLYASSSSVYGANTKVPFAVEDNVDHPISLYAATKKANELMAHAYSHLYRLPCTGLRFFTVYGTWGRPDMAMYLFADAITNGQADPPVQQRRDAARLHLCRRRDRGGGAADGSRAAGRRCSRSDAGTSAAPWRVYNIGNNQPEDLMKVVALLERELGRTAKKQFLPMQPGDVPETFADVRDLEREIGFRPKTSIEEGIRRFVAWYRDYHKV